jgi:hypothetical protein
VADSNVDLLHWFGEDERDECTSCGECAVVTIPEALASFCLACGAVWLDGKALDVSLPRGAPLLPS